MIQRSLLTEYLNNFLSIECYQDYAPNGLQVEGTETIQKICTAVTASLDVIQEAVDLQADALLVHHGFFWRGEAPTIIGMRRYRLEKILRQQINLLAYHLPLDCHPIIGNNVLLGKKIGVRDALGHMCNNTSNLLWSGEFVESISVDQMKHQLTQHFGRVPLVVEGLSSKIKKIAWCTGAAQDFIEQAKSLGADAYLSGEISERTYYQAKELNIHYFSCGHHATERFGIRALGEHLASQFDLTHFFIDSPNPV